MYEIHVHICDICPRKEVLGPLGLDRNQTTCVAPQKFYVEPVHWKHHMGSPNAQSDSNLGLSVIFLRFLKNLQIDPRLESVCGPGSTPF